MDTTELGRLPRSYEVTPAGLFHARRAAIQMEATAASPLGSQPARHPEHDTQSIGFAASNRRSRTRKNEPLGMCYSLLPIPWCTRAEYGQVASRLVPGRPVTKPTNHTP